MMRLDLINNGKPPAHGRHDVFYRKGTFVPTRTVCRSIAADQGQSLERLKMSSKAKVQQLVNEGFTLPDMDLAIKELLFSCPIKKEEIASQAFLLGQGVWEVFYAPHISRMSSVMSMQFQPITYNLQGDKLISNVKYSHSLFGSGWLSAAGTMGRKYDDTVEVKFDRFWMDGPETLRQDVSINESNGMDVDAWMTKLGRNLFFPQLALFPLHYLDEDMCVFEFPPLNTKIAVKRIDPAMPAVYNRPF